MMNHNPSKPVHPHSLIAERERLREKPSSYEECSTMLDDSKPPGAIRSRFLRRERCLGAVLVCLAFLLSGSGPSSAASLAWQPASSPAAARTDHAAVRLADGRVLVTGGVMDPTGAEIYDPAIDQWQSAAPMTGARYGHSATLLPDGSVLVAGGMQASGIGLKSAERYDPILNQWVDLPEMAALRGYHSATALEDGRVLVAGGGFKTSSSEIFDPAATGGLGAWLPTGDLNVGRNHHSATRLDDGRVLAVAGGGFESSVEVFDPAAAGGVGAWSIAASLDEGRWLHAAAPLGGARVLVAGGQGASGQTLDDSWIYDASSNAWTQTPDLGEGRYSHRAIALGDGTLAMIGGTSQGTSFLASVEVFDSAVNAGMGSWQTTGALNDARSVHSVTQLLGGCLLVVGGNGASGSAERSCRAGPCDEILEIPISSTDPDSLFLARLAEAGTYPGDLKGLGSAQLDMAVAHSFTGLERPGMKIVEASLVMVAEPSGYGSNNDAFHLMVARGSWAASPRLGYYFDVGAGGLAGLGLGWASGQAPATITRDLHALPGGAALLDAMNQDGRLDLYIQDDTTLLRAVLRLRYVCCEVWESYPVTSVGAGPELDAHLTSHGMPPANRKGLGSTTANRVVAHTFAGLDRPGTTITAAELVLGAEPHQDDPGNDALHLLVAPNAPTQSWFFDKDQAAPNLGMDWSVGEPAQGFVLPLTSATLASMNAAGRLDLFVQDDSAMHSLRLRVYYACCGEQVTLSRDAAAAPSAELVDHINTVGFLGIKGFGDDTDERAFAHSFTGLGRPGMHVSRAELIVRGHVGGSNDTASLLVAKAHPDASQTWALNGNWDAAQNQSQPFVIDRGSHPTLFLALEQSGRLDVYVQDDSRVDALVLRLRYDCGPFLDDVGPGPDVPPDALVHNPEKDLWMEDTSYTVAASNIEDSGGQPDPVMAGKAMWQSRAIWVRNEAYDVNDPTKACQNTEAQNPIYAGQGFANTVCVKVGNRGSLMADGQISLYWAKAALGLAWDDGPGGQPGTTNGDWTRLTTVLPVQVGPQSETIVAFPWEPPEPSAGGEVHACLLARIEAQPPDRIWTETQDLSYNAAMNNNIAWRNVQVVRDILVGSGEEGSGSHPVILRNTLPLSRTLAIQLRVAEGSEGFFDRGRVIVDLPVPLFDRWKARGGAGRGFRIVPDSSSVVVDGEEGALLRGLPMAAGQAEMLNLRFEAKEVFDLAGLEQEAPQVYDIELAQLSDEDGALMEEGGVAYALRLPEDPWGGSPTPTPTLTSTPTQTASPSPTSTGGTTKPGSTPTSTPTPTPTASPSPSATGSATPNSMTPGAPPSDWLLYVPWIAR